MTRDSAQKEIDEAAGELARPRSDAAQVVVALTLMPQVVCAGGPNDLDPAGPGQTGSCCDGNCRH
jgi:hypothetical protein